MGSWVSGTLCGESLAPVAALATLRFQHAGGITFHLVQHPPESRTSATTSMALRRSRAGSMLTCCQRSHWQGWCRSGPRPVGPAQLQLGIFQIILGQHMPAIAQQHSDQQGFEEVCNGLRMRL